MLDFNPHSREGSDTTEVKESVDSLPISIHTPVKGVTKLYFIAKKKIGHISIHTPVKGVTRY